MQRDTFLPDDHDFLVNLVGKVIHQYPAYEQCNTDAVAKKAILTGIRIKAGAYEDFTLCEHCF